jgi:hypothetical protein
MENVSQQVRNVMDHVLLDTSKLEISANRIKISENIRNVMEFL